MKMKRNIMILAPVVALIGFLAIKPPAMGNEFTGNSSTPLAPTEVTNSPATDPGKVDSPLASDSMNAPLAPPVIRGDDDGEDEDGEYGDRDHEDRDHDDRDFDDEGDDEGDDGWHHEDDHFEDDED